jgi:hypothetical protein
MCTWIDLILYAFTSVKSPPLRFFANAVEGDDDYFDEVVGAVSNEQRNAEEGLDDNRF